MKRVMSAILSLAMLVSCIAITSFSAFAADEYVQKVKLTKEQYTPKTIYTDDDFEDRTDSLADSDNEYRVSDSSVFAPASDEDGEKYVTNETTWKSLIFREKNDIDADRLAVSFKFRNNGDYFEFLMPTSSGDKKRLFSLQTATTMQSGNIKFKPYGSGDSDLVNFGNYNVPKTEWTHISFELERVKDTDAETDNAYKVYMRKFYVADKNGVTSNIMTNFSSWGGLKELETGTQVDVDWWSGKVSSAAIRIGQVNKVGLNIDDALMYEPDTFRLDNAAYDETSNSVKAVFTRGVNESSLSNIMLTEAGEEVEETVALDPNDSSQRTVILTPNETLDLKNKGYTLVANNILGYDGDECADCSIDFGKPAGKYVRVKLTKDQYTPKAIYTDDDFEDRTSSLAGSKNVYRVSDSSVFVPDSDDGGEKYVKNEAAWKSLIFREKNNINADRLAVSFRFRNNGDYFQIQMPDSSGETKNLFFFQQTMDTSGTINFMPFGKSSRVLIGNSNVARDKWTRINFELERVMDADSGNYKVYLRKFYVVGEDGVPTDIMANFSWPSLKDLGTQVDVDWWSGSVSSSAIRIGQINKVGLNIDDVLMYEPDSFRMNYAAYDEASNSVKAVFTRGINESSLSDIILLGAGEEVNATVTLDPSDSSQRTVVLTPNETLDLENISYTFIANNVLGYDGDETANDRISFGKPDEYSQRVKLTKEQYTPKTIYTDDDFEDRTNALTDSLNEYRISDNSEQCSIVSEGEKKYLSATAWKKVIFREKNDIDADKLTVSFKFKDNGNYYHLWMPDSSGESKCLFAFQQTTAGTSGIVKFVPVGKSSAESLQIGNSNVAREDWTHISFELERVMDAKSGNYKVYLRKFYTADDDGVTADLMPNFLTWGGLKDLETGTQVDVDWWSGSVSSAAIRLNQISHTGLNIDDVLIYEPDTFRMDNAAYDEASNSVKAVFTRGVNESSLNGITLFEGTRKAAATVAFDPNDSSQRTVILTPGKALDLENISYTFRVNVSGYDGDEVVNDHIAFGKPAIDVKSVGFYTDDKLILGYSPNQVITGKAVLSNPTEEALEIMPLIAYYEDEILKSVGTSNTVTVAAGTTGEITASLSLPSQIESGRLRFFAFENGNLRPIIETYNYEENVNLYLIGDSVCDDTSWNSEITPTRGWGGFIGEFFYEDNVNVINHGHSGYTIMNFMNGDGWAKHNYVKCSWDIIKEEVKSGDYVMVSLGINDNSRINKGEFTWDDYQNALRTIIDDVAAKGAKILLITSTPQGGASPTSTGEFNNMGAETPRQKMIEVAQEKGVACFDLNTKMKAALNQLVEDGVYTADQMRAKYKTDEEGNVVKDENGSSIVESPGVIYSDGTHYVAGGARLIAKLIAEYITETQYPLYVFAKDMVTE